MDIAQLIERADEAYGDGVVKAYYEDRDGEHGDTLARFIAVELEETFDPDASDEEQLAEARRVMQTALDELARLVDKLAG